MASLIDRLFDVLDEQTEYCKQLLELSREKKDVIINNDVAALQKITWLENMLISRNNRADKARLRAMNEMAAACGKAPAEFSAWELVGLLAGRPEGWRLAEAVSGICGMVDELHQANEENRVLIENSINYIDFSMNMIKEVLSGEPVYYTAAGDEMPRRRVILDMRY